jgi:hypothetical protein
LKRGVGFSRLLSTLRERRCTDYARLLQRHPRSLLLIATSSNPYTLPPFSLASSPCQRCAASSAELKLEGTENNSTRLPMNTKITLELTPEQIRFLRYVAELEGLTVEQYLLRFAKGQIVHLINSQKS